MQRKFSKEDNMHTITQRQLIQGLAGKWRKQYEPFKDDKPLFFWRTGVTSPPLNKQQIANRLDLLNTDTATPEEVEEIIGNSSWTRLVCNECQKEVETVVQVGEPSDYESRTANLCKDCVQKACDLMLKA